MDKLNCAMRDSAVEAGCYSKQHVNQKGIGALNLVNCEIVKGFGDWLLECVNKKVNTGEIVTDCL